VPGAASAATIGTDAVCGRADVDGVARAGGAGCLATILGAGGGATLGARLGGGGGLRGRRSAMVTAGASAMVGGAVRRDAGGGGAGGDATGGGSPAARGGAGGRSCGAACGRAAGAGTPSGLEAGLAPVAAVMPGVETISTATAAPGSGCGGCSIQSIAATARCAPAEITSAGASSERRAGDAVTRAVAARSGSLASLGPSLTRSAPSAPIGAALAGFSADCVTANGAPSRFRTPGNGG
jgi:hypothetical protein